MLFRSIEGAADQQTVLLRSGDGWRLPDFGNFPADRQRIEDMLHRLLAIREDFPVDSSPEALIRFKLADDDFERRIILSGGDKTLATLYVGTPEGPRQVHARRAGSDDAYAVAFGLFDVPLAAADWTDKGVAQIPQDDIVALQVNGLHLVAPIAGDAGTAWQLDGDAEGSPEGAELKPAAAVRLASRLSALRVEQVLGTETDPGDGLAEPQLRLGVTRKDGKRVDYRLGRAAMTGVYTLKVSTRPEHFRVSSYTAHQLIEAARRDTLLAKPKQNVAAPLSN